MSLVKRRVATRAEESKFACAQRGLKIRQLQRESIKNAIDGIPIDGLGLAIKEPPFTVQTLLSAGVFIT